MFRLKLVSVLIVSVLLGIPSISVFAKDDQREIEILQRHRSRDIQYLLQTYGSYIVQMHIYLSGPVFDPSGGQSYEKKFAETYAPFVKLGKKDGYEFYAEQELIDLLTSAVPPTPLRQFMSDLDRPKFFYIALPIERFFKELREAAVSINSDSKSTYQFSYVLSDFKDKVMQPFYAAFAGADASDFFQQSLPPIETPMGRRARISLEAVAETLSRTFKMAKIKPLHKSKWIHIFLKQTVDQLDRLIRQNAGATEVFAFGKEFGHLVPAIRTTEIAALSKGDQNIVINEMCRLGKAIREANGDTHRLWELLPDEEANEIWGRNAFLMTFGNCDGVKRLYDTESLKRLIILLRDVGLQTENAPNHASKLNHVRASQKIIKDIITQLNRVLAPNLTLSQITVEDISLCKVEKIFNSKIDIERVLRSKGIKTINALKKASGDEVGADILSFGAIFGVIKKTFNENKGNLTCPR